MYRLYISTVFTPTTAGFNRWHPRPCNHCLSRCHQHHLRHPHDAYTGDLTSLSNKITNQIWIHIKTFMYKKAILTIMRFLTYQCSPVITPIITHMIPSHVLSRATTYEQTQSIPCIPRMPEKGQNNIMPRTILILKLRYAISCQSSFECRRRQWNIIGCYSTHMKGDLGHRSQNFRLVAE